MKSVSIIAAAAVMLASSASAASNDPRECEGELYLLNHFSLSPLAYTLGCSKNINRLTLLDYVIQK